MLFAAISDLVDGPCQGAEAETRRRGASRIKPSMAEPFLAGPCFTAHPKGCGDLQSEKHSTVSIQTGLPNGSGAKAEVRGVLMIGRNAVVVAMGTDYAPLRPVSYETAMLFC